MKTKSLLIEAIGLKAETQGEVGELLYQELNVPSGTTEICVEITQDDTQHAFTVFRGAAQRLGYDEVFTLTVPVEWRDGKPHTRTRGEDNVDIILPEDGRFWDLQVGIVTRAGRFFLICQNIWSGWILKDGSFVPALWEDNYPGSDYTKVWEGMAQAIREMIPKLGLSLCSEEVQAPDWDPIFPPEEKGWESGVVLYFNAITGTGLVRGEDGKVYFVHFSRILAEGLPVLDAGQGVYFRPGKEEPGMEHTPVRSVKAAA